jgi:hypothetical protein
MLSEVNVTNVERLIAAGVLVDAGLTDDARDRINSIDLSDDHLKKMQEIKDTLGLEPVSWSAYGKALRGHL